MTKVIEKLKVEIVKYAKKLAEKNYVVGPAGNISCRLPDEKTFLITPSSVTYDELKPSDILTVDFNGDVLVGDLNPSRETQMHLSIYKSQEDAGSVIHSHPPYSTVLSITGKKIPPLMDEFVVFVGGEVKVAEYAISGSEELAENAVRALSDNRAVLLANHGLLCYGKTISDAFFITELVEETAKIYVHSLSIGKPKTLPEEVVIEQLELFKLLKLREKE